GRGGDDRTRASRPSAPPPGAGVRLRPGGRVRTGDRRPADQGTQGGRDVLRADRVPAPSVEEPGQGEDPRHRGRAAPAGRQADRHPGTEEGLTGARSTTGTWKGCRVQQVAADKLQSILAPKPQSETAIEREGQTRYRM